VKPSRDAGGHAAHQHISGCGAADGGLFVVMGNTMPPRDPDEDDDEDDEEEEDHEDEPPVVREPDED
jgi:hypothetical protein